MAVVLKAHGLGSGPALASSMVAPAQVLVPKLIHAEVICYQLFLFLQLRDRTINSE